MVTFAEHYRLTLIGELPGREIFSCSLSLIPDPASTLSYTLDGWFEDEVTHTDFADMVTDSTNFWSNPDAMISEVAVLKRVKFAFIGTDGKYKKAPLEAAVNTPGAGTQSLARDPMPNQVARKVTFETDADLGRIKGGFYLPGVRTAGWDYATQLTGEVETARIANEVEGYIEDLENAPGLDTRALQVVVASTGRHNADGSVRVAAGNYDVKRVNVGRRLDIVRRRANKISEARMADIPVTSSS